MVGTVGTDYLRAAGLVCSRFRTRPEPHAARLVGCRLEERSFEDVKEYSFMSPKEYSFLFNNNKRTLLLTL